MRDCGTILGGLATFPLIGGSVAILGKPTKAVVPTTWELMDSYKAWLFYEQPMPAAPQPSTRARLVVRLLDVHSRNV